MPIYHRVGRSMPSRAVSLRCRIRGPFQYLSAAMKPTGRTSRETLNWLRTNTCQAGVVRCSPHVDTHVASNRDYCKTDVSPAWPLLMDEADMASFWRQLAKPFCEDKKPTGFSVRHQPLCQGTWRLSRRVQAPSRARWPSVDRSRLAGAILRAKGNSFFAGP